MHILARHAAIC